MKILYFTSDFEDYLQDQLLIGFRSILGEHIIDFPKKDVLYSSSKKEKRELYGRGFTIWKTLPEITIDRENISQRIKSNEFDLIIFSSIWRQRKYFKNYIFSLIKSKSQIMFFDGEDHTKIYEKALPFGKYYKREQLFDIKSLFIKKIGFSIPKMKIRGDQVVKTKLFAKHNQCDEAYKIDEVKKHCVKSYAFSDEHEYYLDIAQSQYGITMKKAGWDCMRHYEIAANLAIPCFYQLDLKPENCAPHGLQDMVNVISFNSAKELEEKIELIDKNGLYEKIQKNVSQWIQNNNCEKVAKNLIKKYFSKNL